MGKVNVTYLDSDGNYERGQAIPTKAKNLPKGFKIYAWDLVVITIIVVVSVVLGTYVGLRVVESMLEPALAPKTSQRVTPSAIDQGPVGESESATPDKTIDPLNPNSIIKYTNPITGSGL